MRFVVRSLAFLALSGLLATEVANAAGALTVTSPGSSITVPIGIIQFPLQASGGVAPYTFSVTAGALPPGLAIRTDVPSFFNVSATSGIIGVAAASDGGTPYSFTLHVVDSTPGTALTGDLAVTMHITSENFMDLNNLPDAIANSPYSYTFTVLNGHTPVISLAPGSNPLPTGLSLTGATLSGTPTVASQTSSNFQLLITDGADTIQHGFNLRVAGPHITNSLPLPNGTQNVAYGPGGAGVSLTASGGAGGYSYQITGGNLPNGLSLSSGGLISGTVCNCAGPNTYQFAVTVTDSGSSSYQQFMAIDVVAASPVLPSIGLNYIDDQPVGIPTSISVAANGGLAPYTWNVTGLPAGMSFRSGAGTSSNINFGNLEIWGVAQSVGLNQVTVTATDANNVSVSQTLPFRISALAYAQISGNLNGNFTRGTLINPSFLRRILGGTGPYNSLLISSGPASGTNISGGATGLTLSGTPAENGNFSYRVLANDTAANTLTKTFNDQIAPSGLQIFTNSFIGNFTTGNSINFGFNACCATGSLTWSIPTANGNALPSGLSLSGAGALTGTAAAGPYSFFVQATDSANPSTPALKQFSIYFTPISITTNSVPFGNMNAAYTGLQFAATGTTGNSINWSVNSGFLPPGMSLSSGGLLGGTPTSSGQYNFTVTVSDGTNSASRGYSISIYPPGAAPPVNITSPANLGNFPRGDVEADLFATGGNGTFTWNLASGSLPPGLAIRTDLTNNGSISQGSQAALIGVAQQAGAYSFTLQATSATSTATRAFTMTIGPMNVNDSFNLPDAFAGTAYISSATPPGYTFTPISPAGTMTFSLNSGSNLPSGLSLSTGGTISGTPTTQGNYNFTIVISDGTNIVYRGYNLNVYNIRITTPAILPNATQNQTYSQSLAATDAASGTVTFTANGLPNGLTIQNNVITTAGSAQGVTAGPGLYNVMITASDGTNSYSENFSIDVVATGAQFMRINLFNTSDAVEGDFYSSSIGVCCGGAGPFTWTVSGLPPGLGIRYAGSGTVGTTTGTMSSYITPGNVEIYGIPTSDASPNNQVTLTVTDSASNTTSQTFGLHVSRLNETRGVPNGTIGTAYMRVLRPVGGVPGYTVSVGSGTLPAGLSLSSTTVGGVNTAMISGMPAESGNFNFSLHYADSAGTPNTLDRFYNINIANSTNSNLQINTNSPLQPMVTGNNSVNITLNACCTTGPYTWSVVGGALPSGLSLSSAGVLTGTATPAGNYTFLVQVTDANSNTARKQFTLQISSLQITTTSIPFGNVGTQYNGSSAGLTLTATGGSGSLTWSLQPGSTLPLGVTLSSAGVLAGTPTTTPVSTGQYQPTFVVTDGTNTTSATFTLNVYPAGSGPALTITTNGNLGTWPIGYRQFELDATGGIGAPYTWSLVSGSLPAGYALRTDTPSFFTSNASAGIIGVGTGTQATGAGSATSTFTLQVQSGTQTVQKQFTLTIAQLDYKDPYLPDAFVGQQYNGSSAGFTMTALNGAGPVTFSTTQPTCSINFPTSCLPPGLTLASTGAITGTATTAGAYSFNVQLNDGTSTVNQQYTINVYAIDLTTAPILPNATQGTAYSSGSLTATGGTGTLTWTANNLPNGFSINSATGAITATSGFGAGPGNYSIQVTVTDQNSVSSTKRFALNVIGVPGTLPLLNIGLINDATVGSPTWYDFSVGGGTGPFTYAVSGLPAGMSFRPSIGTVNNNSTAGNLQIWGTSSLIGTSNVTVTVTDANGATASNTFALHVSPLTHDTLPQGTLGIAYNQNLRVVGGTGPYSVTKTIQGALPDGLVRSGLNVAGTPLEDGGFSVSYQYSDSAGTPNTLVRSDFINIGDGSNTFQINNNGNLGTVTLNSNYNNTLNACCVPNSLTWSVVSGTLPTGITLNTNGTLSGSPTVANTYTFLVEASENSVGTPDVAFRYFTMVVTPISLTANNGNGNLPYGVVGTAYSQPLTTSGATGTVTWTVNPGSYLPPALSVASGALSGTPTTAGQFSFTLTGTDTANNIIVRTFNVSIYPAGSGPPLFLSTNQNQFFTLGTQTIQLSASGGTPPYSYSLTPSATAVPGCRVQNGQPLPTFFSSGAGGLLCVVTAPATYSTSIRVTDSASATFDRPINITVSPMILTTQSTLPRGTVGVAYTFNPAATNGTMAVGGTGAYSFSATGLPPGLSIDGTTGVISGNPTTGGNYNNISITVGNASLSYGLTFNNLSIAINPFQITTSGKLPQATIGTAYSQTITSACSSSCTWSVASGSLPSNFSLSTNGNNAVLSTGNSTPNGTFDSSFTLQVTDGTNTAQQIFSLIVAPNTISSLSVATNITTTPTIGSIVSTGLFAAGGKPPYTFSISAGNLPPGITLQSPGDQVGGNLAPGTQYLAGRPTSTGTYNFTVQVTDSTTGTALTATKNFAWTISSLSLNYGSLPISGTSLILNQPYTQQLLVIGGNSTYQNFTVSSPLQTGLALNSSTGVVAGTPTNTGAINDLLTVTDTSATPNTLTAGLNVSVSSSANGTVTLNGPAAGTIVPLGATQTFNITPNGGTAPYTVTPVGALPAGVLLESGSALGSNFNSGNGLQVTFSTPGTYTFTLMAMDSSATTITGERTYTLIVPAVTPILNNSTLPNASISVPYSFQLYSFSTGTVTYAVAPGSALPPGLSISASGLISGTPLTGSAGTYTFSVSFGDGTNSATGTFTLKVTGLNISTAGQLPQAQMNVAYGPSGAGVTLAASGGSGSTTWAISGGSLPSGMSLAPSTGLISGTPDGQTGTGLFNFAVTASNSGGSVTKEFSVYLSLTNPGLLTYQAFLAALPDATLGQNYQYNLTPSGGVAPYSWSLAPGSNPLPTGLHLLPLSGLNGINGSPAVTTIAGSPSAAGSYTFNLVLTDSTSATVTRTFTLNVTPISITVNNPRTAVQGQAYSFQFEATGGTSPYTYTLITNPGNSYGQEPLPPGLTFNGTTGTISGTPTGTGTYNFLLTTTDSTAGTHLTLTKALSITSTNSFGTQVTNTSGSLPINTAINSALTTSSNATYTWAVQNVSPAPAAPIINGTPPGVTLQNGVFIGNPTQAGTYQFVVQATNNANSSDVARRTLTIVITPVTMTNPVETGLFAPYMPVATLNQPYSFQLRAAGGTPPYTFAEVPTYPLPLGMSLSSTGLVSGTPTQSGVYTLRPQVTDSAASPNTLTDYGFKVTLLVIPAGGKPPLETRNSSFSRDDSVGVPHAFVLDRFLLPGVPPYTWSVANGSSLPPGMSLVHGSNGLSDLYAGTPTAAGSYSFTMNVADSAGQSLTIPFNGVDISPMNMTPAELPSAVRGSSYSVALSVTGGTPPYSYQFDQGFAPPPGMSINNGVLSGIPTYAGVFPIGIAVMDSASHHLIRDYEFSVDDAAGEVPSVSLAPNPVNVLFLSGSSTTSTPLTVSSSSGSLPYTAGLYGVSGASLTTTSGVTSLNYGSLTAGSYSGFAVASASGAVNDDDVAPVNITVLVPPPCAYTLATTTTSSPIGGNSGNINISAGAGCTWTASPVDSWITLTGAMSGTGNGTIPYSTAANGTGNPRTGTVTITGSTGTVTFTINQFAAGCSFSINPATVNATAAGGGATVNVVSSGSGCPWTVTGLTGGLTADTAGSTGGGVVNVTIPANAVANPQTLTATIAGQTFTVNQASAACNYTLSAGTATFAATGGSGSVNVTAPSGCPINTVLGPSWINVTSGSSGIATGGAQALTYTVDPNSTTLPRTGALTISGQTYAITEQALACSVSVDTSTLGSPFAPAGGNAIGTVGITTNGSNCPWTAASNSSFVTVSPTNGFGTGTVTLNVTSNAASTNARAGSLTISGQTIGFSQAGTTCTYSLRSSSSSMPSTGGLATVSVVAPSACTWTATANSGFLSIVNAGNAGSADVTFSAAANATANPVTGTLTVAGQTFTVNEAAAPCSYTPVSLSSGVLASTAVGPLQVTYTASASGCTPTVTSYSNWITASNSFAGTSGTMTYSIAANSSGTTRSGNVQIGDKVFNVVQTGSACSYSLNSYGIVVNYLGANSSILGSANLNSCPNPPDGSTQPFVQVGTLTGTPSLYTLPFVVSPFSSANTTIRVGTITFGGLTFYVKQSSY